MKSILWAVALIFFTGFATYFVKYKLIPGIKLWFIILRLRKVLKQMQRQNPDDPKLKQALDLSGKLLKSRPWLTDDD